jgi:succinate dehydrogenase / fumarate reductase cytochrome b subunit
LRPAARGKVLSVAIGEGGFSGRDCRRIRCVRLCVLGCLGIAHHFFAGLRHLALDVHWGVDLKHARQSSLAVMLAAALATLVAAWRLFA